MTGAAVILCGWLMIERRLNFDEWLLVRSSWLIAADTKGNIPFFMPLTAALSTVHDRVPAPSTLLLALRCAAFTLITLCLLFAFRQHEQDRATRALALLLTLSSGVFLAHGFELRYDIVILTAWLVAWGLAARTRPGVTTALAWGLLAALLAVHHTKGLFYAACLVVLVTPAMWRLRRPSAAFWLSMTAALLAWLAWLLWSQHWPEAWRLYREFATLGVQHDRQTAWTTLTPRVRTDMTWWLLTGFAGLSLILRLRRGELRPSHQAWWVMPPVVFIALHPHPWDYLLAPIIPFLALMAARELVHLARQHVSWPASTRVMLGAMIVAALGGPHVLHTVAARGHLDRQTLNLAHELKQDGDHVLDPSGALYMMAPASPDWYRDTLWSSSTPTTTPAAAWERASIVVETYRLKWITPEWAEELSKHHVRACGWLWIRQDDPRLSSFRARCPPSVDHQLLNYWERAS